jgi:hypothetical protein
VPFPIVDEADCFLGLVSIDHQFDGTMLQPIRILDRYLVGR